MNLLFFSFGSWADAFIVRDKHCSSPCIFMRYLWITFYFHFFFISWRFRNVGWGGFLAGFSISSTFLATLLNFTLCFICSSNCFVLPTTGDEIKRDVYV